jgi:hypothetical protein
MKFFKPSIVIKSFLILILPAWVGAAEFHVSKSWELALALRSAAENGADDTIFLNAGTYSGKFLYETNEMNSLTIKAEEGLRAEEVIINNDNTGSFKIRMEDENNIMSLIIKNITICSIDISIYINGKFIVENCIFKALKPSTIGSSSDLFFINNTIMNANSRWDIGGVKNHKFKNNKVFNNCNTINIVGRSVEFEKNIIVNNENLSFFFLNTSFPIIKNNIIANNAKFSFGYLLGRPIVQNNTIINNDNFNICQSADTCINNLTYETTDEYNPFIDLENNDFHLKPDSPYIDAGTNENIPYTATDIEGNPRIANGTVDLGAYEFTTNTPHPADINENWVIESEEFNAYNTAWKNVNSWPTIPNQIPAEYLTRAGLLLKKGGRYKDVSILGIPRPLCWMPNN